VRIVTVPAKVKKESSHAQGAQTEGEAAHELLQLHGYMRRRQAASNGQWEYPCPFHEEPGTLGKSQGTKFYMNTNTSQYHCKSATCGEQGNLQALEEYFGVESDPILSARFKSKDTTLKEFQASLTAEHRDFLLRDKGLDFDTVDRFRIGYSRDHNAYVIPYLESRRPVAFRYYDPVERGRDDKDRPIYGGPNGSKYWWESSDESIKHVDENVLRLFNPGAANGDPADAEPYVFICEGEFKAMLLTQLGFAAVSIPGVNGFKAEWARHFMRVNTVYIVMDNDNPEHHKKGAGERCPKCENVGEERCVGHNPGQDGAAKLVDFFGYRGRNVLLPLPDGERKTDINEYVMRDGHTKNEFLKLVTGKSDDSIYLARSLGAIRADPPPETMYLVDQLVPVAGRLLVTGAPKVGKSIWIENLVLSIASGIPFLHRFEIANTRMTPGHRVLLLDRELSERSLFDRLNQLIAERPGYGVADDKLLIDHRFQLALDQPTQQTT
jgi:hypothetical protein